MLTVEENERITRVGPGTPMGKYLRRYWWPLCLSTELPERDGAPLRVRLLGEDLIAFRDTDGNVGLVDAYCPHRRAPMFFGRNEECGLRCVYHGWKFDRHGDCVDMPSEPAGTPLQAKVKIKAYPTCREGRRHLDAIWVRRTSSPSRPITNGCARPPRIATSPRRSRTAIGCRRWKAASTPRIPPSRITTSSATTHDAAPARPLAAPRCRAHRLRLLLRLDAQRGRTDKYYVRVYHYVMPRQQIAREHHQVLRQAREDPEARRSHLGSHRRLTRPMSTT